MAIGKDYVNIFETLKRMGELKDCMAKLDEQIGLLPELEEHEQAEPKQPTKLGGTTVE